MRKKYGHVNFSKCADPNVFATAACNIYVSEGRDANIVQKLVKVPKRKSEVMLGHVFVDEAYNRTGITIVGKTVSAIVNTAVDIADTALSLIDLTMHRASHPRLGVVDHIACHSLLPPDVPKEMADDAARLIAQQLATGKHPLPCYLYGSASASSSQGEVTLASIRRNFNYFSSNRNAEWEGCSSQDEYLAKFPPAFGPHHVNPQWGVACIGSTPWVVNHNILLETEDVSIAKEIARSVSERGGGLKHVQAMGLATNGGVEIACNLLDERATSPDDVDNRVQELAGSYNIRLLKSYQTGKSTKELLGLLDTWMDIPEHHHQV